MRFSLLMFIIVSNALLYYLKLLEFAFLFEILEIVLYLMLVPLVKSCPSATASLPNDVFQLPRP